MPKWLGWIKDWRAALAAAIVVAVCFGATTFAVRRDDPVLLSSDPDARTALEIIKRDFPGDYATLRTLLATNPGSDAKRAAGKAFIARNYQHHRTASEGLLAEHFAYVARGVTRWARDDPAGCVAVGDGRDVSLNSNAYDPAGFLAIVRLLKAGRDDPHIHGAPTAADHALLGEMMARPDFRDAILAQIPGADQPGSDEAQCAKGVLYFEALTRLPASTAARLIQE